MQYKKKQKSMQFKACQPCTELVLRYMYLGTTAMSVINMMVGVCNLNYDDQIISLILSVVYGLGQQYQAHPHYYAF